MMAALLLNIFVTSLSFAIHRGTHLYKMELEFCLGRKFSLEENWERFFFLALFFVVGAIFFQSISIFLLWFHAKFWQLGDLWTLPESVLKNGNVWWWLSDGFFSFFASVLPSCNIHQCERLHEGRKPFCLRVVVFFPLLSKFFHSFFGKLRTSPLALFN